MSASYTPVSAGIAKVKITIKSLDDGTEVIAQYNPKELQIDKPGGWEVKPDTAKSTGPKDKAKKNAGINVQFTGVKARTMSVELLFDAYEKDAKGPYTCKIEEEIGKLEHLASTRNPGVAKEDEKRPHHCVADWGGTLRAFKCVVESVSTKYTMFDTDGTPLRATCTLKLMEADNVSTASKSGK